jgi:hypothetical protein
MADAVTPHAEVAGPTRGRRDRLRVVADKVQKNLFSSRRVYEFIAR